MSKTRRVRASVQLPDAARRDIAQLLDMSGELPRIIAASKELTPSAQAFELLAELADEVKLNAKDVRQVFTALENLRSLTETYESVESAIERIKSGVDEQLAARVDNCKDQLIEASGLYDADNPVSLSFKSQRLVYRRDKLFHDVEVITDARPVFDRSAEKVVEFVITHELSIEFMRNDLFESFYLALDNADLLKLRKACDRAILKSRTLKAVLKDHHIEIHHDEDD